jgi:hypothetical protein
MNYVPVVLMYVLYLYTLYVATEIIPMHGVSTKDVVSNVAIMYYIHM